MQVGDIGRQVAGGKAEDVRRPVLLAELGVQLAEVVIVGQQDRATEARARAQIARLSAAAAALDRSASRELVAA